MSKKINEISKEECLNGKDRRHSIWTNEEDKILLELREKGTKFLDIAKILGRTYSATQRRYHNLTEYTREEVEKLLELANAGLGVYEISKALNKSHHSVPLKYYHITGKHLNL